MQSPKEWDILSAILRVFLKLVLSKFHYIVKSQFFVVVAFIFQFDQLMTMRINRNNLTKLNRSLSDQFEKDLKDPENRQYLLLHARWFHRFFRLHYFYTGAIVMLMCLTPLLALRHGEYARAYPQLVPFDTEKGIFI